MKALIRLGLSSGDPDGIGSEILGKALARLGPCRGVQFYFWRSPQCPKKHLEWIDSEFTRVTVPSWEKAKKIKLNPTQVIDIKTNLSAAHWVEASAQACVSGDLDGLATAPLSKTLIRDSGLREIGHTEILQRVCRSRLNKPSLFMGFIGKKFNVLLTTGHQSVRLASRSLNFSRLKESLWQAHNMKKILPLKRQSKPIALVGLNPHAGEQGLIGREELLFFNKAVDDLQSDGVEIVGPIPPDTAFLKHNWERYSIYVCPLHDQGLIPFKLVHGWRTGVHLTLGLPFVRTSVDHGTAKDIFGKNQANSQSMIDAIKVAIRLCRLQRTQKMKNGVSP